jgi:YD repeat-containing protein
MDRETCTKTDLRGRANEVHAPAEPWLRYTYDEAGRMTMAELIGGGVQQSRTELFYDIAGRKTQMNDPDMGTWYYQYDAAGALTRQTDAKGQVLLMSYDPLDRLASKGKLTFEDLFDTKSTTHWTWSAAQTVPYNDGGNNVVMNTGDFVNWRGFNRSGYALASGKALQLRFKVDDTATDVHFMIENNDSTYRRFAAYVTGGALTAQYNNGSGFYAGNTLISSLQANVWYVLRITLDDVNGFVVEAYEENNPANRGAFTYSMAAGKSWRFSSTIKNYISYVDDYREMDVLARYNYDEYNPANAQWGRGLRTGMIDGSGKTNWRYDQRGRLRWESKTISGSGTFVTEWSYNSADLVEWMKYPGGNGGQQGEQVTYSYHPQMLVKSAYSNTAGYHYMQNASYDAAGRMTQIVRGPGSLTSSYSYYGWQETVPVQGEDVFQGARLKQMTTVGNLQYPNLQDLSYLYDEAGNVLRILDAANSNQKQCFAYDALDRLTQATTYNNAGLGCTVQVGNGNYHQDYSYRDFDGNLGSKSGMGAYNYNDGNHKHAVTSTGNGWTFTYDANGNMTQRNTGTVLDMSYDAENRLVQVNKNGALHMTNIYDGDGERVKTIIEGTQSDTVTT